MRSTTCPERNWRCTDLETLRVNSLTQKAAHSSFHQCRRRYVLKASSPKTGMEEKTFKQTWVGRTLRKRNKHRLMPDSNHDLRKELNEAFNVQIGDSGEFPHTKAVHTSFRQCRLLTLKSSKASPLKTGMEMKLSIKYARCAATRAPLDAELES